MRYVYGFTLLAMLAAALGMRFLGASQDIDIALCIAVGAGTFAMLRAVEGIRHRRAVKARRAALRRAHSLPVQ